MEKFLDPDLPSLAVRLSDGSHLDLVFTWQRCGIVSVIVFTLLFIFLLFPLEGQIWLKLAWLELGMLVGLVWGFLRISIAVLFAYCFGNSVFSVAEFLLSPFTDFFWILSLWSLGLSSLISAKHSK